MLVGSCRKDVGFEGLGVVLMTRRDRRGCSTRLLDAIDLA